MRIIVFGANGPTGRLLTTQALAEGHDVTAFVRNPETFPIVHPQLWLAPGDVLDADDVRWAVAGHDVVLSTLGAPFSRAPIAVYSVGGRHLLDAMQAAGVGRFACVTSSACERNPGRTGGLVFDRVVQPLVVNTIGRTVYDDMRRLEELVMTSELAWTIVRPSGLFDAEGVTAYRVGERHLPARFTSRADLADCLLRQATDDTWVRKQVAVATVEARPSMVQLIWREGIRKSA